MTNPFEVIDKRLSNIENLLLDIKHPPASKVLDESKENFLTITEAASFLKISVNTIYSKVSRKELPSMKKNGRLYFSNLDLVNYLKSGRKLTNDEVDAAAENYLSKK